jgi:hypothetical protein
MAWVSTAFWISTLARHASIAASDKAPQGGHCLLGRAARPIGLFGKIDVEICKEPLRAIAARQHGCVERQAVEREIAEDEPHFARFDVFFLQAR